MDDEFELFKREVKSSYELLKNQRLLPSELERGSSAKLMGYLLLLLSTDKLKNDIPTLNKIFNPGNIHLNLETAIRKFHRSEKFKPLQYFLRGKTLKPEENIIKLLAVLIDFQPRPFNKWREVRLSSINGNIEEAKETLLFEGREGGQAGTKPEGTEDGKPRSDKDGERQTENGLEGERDGPPKDIKPTITEGPFRETGNTKGKSKLGSWSKFKRPALYGGIVAAVIILVLLLMGNQCMHWEIDRYVPVACDAKIEGAEIIPLDRELVKNFRKIMQPDTLTRNALGKVWYVKINADSAEFYTAAGFYPLDRDKILKPITMYILSKYVLDKKNNPTISAP